MTQLQDLLRQNVADPPPDDVDLAALVAAGRQRARARRLRIAGVVALVTVVAAGTAVAAPRVNRAGGPTDDLPAPDAPTVRLSDAKDATSSDVRVLASLTDENLVRDNGQYFDGVTDDGLVLFRDGPRIGQLFPRFALMNPATEQKDWLPRLPIGQDETSPVELDAQRLVLIRYPGSSDERMSAEVFDRETREWRAVRWPGLPAAMPERQLVGPDHRLYLLVPATQGHPPPGGFPSDNGEVDDAGAEGDTYDLWSVSLTDSTDVRDEHLTLGSLAFTPTSMVWTDRTNGSAGLVHVRDLATGDEHSFDPRSGERCNLLSFSATTDRVVLGEYCGTYGRVRDDRVQILSADGDQVATIQDSGVEGAISSLHGDNDLVTVTAFDSPSPGTYVYDLATDRFLRVSHQSSNFDLGGPTIASQVMWATPANHRQGATQWLGELAD